MKNAADGASGIMLRLELMEGKSPCEAKEFATELGAGTSTCLRLSRPWWGTNRILCGDSAFASLKTAVQLRKRGLHFSGVVKTAYLHFPLKFLNKVELNEPSDCATVEGAPLIAHVWLDKKRKHFVSTCRKTLPREPLKEKRYRRGEGGLPETLFKAGPPLI